MFICLTAQSRLQRIFHSLHSNSLKSIAYIQAIFICLEHVWISFNKEHTNVFKKDLKEKRKNQKKKNIIQAKNVMDELITLSVSVQKILKFLLIIITYSPENSSHT